MRSNIHKKATHSLLGMCGLREVLGLREYLILYRLSSCDFLYRLIQTIDVRVATFVDAVHDVLLTLTETNNDAVSLYMIFEPAT